MQPSPVRCGCFIFVENRAKYIPLTGFHAHTTIVGGSSRTTLTQLFENPETSKPLEELRYAFPLYDGVSVVKFTCHVGERVIQGVIHEKAKAKEVYDKAKEEGRTAGLLEQSPDAGDVFNARIGNVGAGEGITVEIEYLGELVHDAEADAVRFTIPTTIAPRYGQSDTLGAPGANPFATPVTHTGEKPFSVTVDAQMPDGTSIKSVQSPSHPISVQIGYSSQDASSGEPSLQRASATLSQGSVELDKDFILQVAATKLGEPSAILEKHPTVPNQRALMTTLVPKFNLPQEKPEIVFLCDRSGSMGDGDRIANLQNSLRIFLKSLPVGVKFNICSFGGRHEFLWDRSQTYDQASLDKAFDYVNGFSANFGGTHMFTPLQKTFEQRYKDMNLEVFLLTDGQIWNQDQLFQLINQQVAESDGGIRLFSLGIGSGASTSLVQGMARAGNGFSQSVGENEQMTKKVVRMLKASLMPHIQDYTLEIKYDKSKDTEDTDDDDFEIIEKMTDCLNVGTEDTKTDVATDFTEKKPISLYDPSSTDDDGDTTMPDAQKSADVKYDHLPSVTTPEYLQTPYQIPALFPFNRTNVYILLSDDDSKNRIAKSVLLKGTSQHGPLELEIPVTNIQEPGETIHQLAARKAVKELEEGRGWIFHAKDEQDSKLLKDKFDGRFSDMVEREGVRLGLKYQIAGKWCSFVAEDLSGGHSSEEKDEMSIDSAEDHSLRRRQPVNALMAKLGAPGMAPTAYSCRTGGPTKKKKKMTGFEVPPPPPAPSAAGGLFSMQAIPPPPPPAPAGGALFGAAPRATYIPQMEQSVKFGGPPADSDSSDSVQGFGLIDDGDAGPAPTVQKEDPLQSLAAEQSFFGSWEWSDKLEGVLGTNKQAADSAAKSGGADGQIRDTALATACVVVYLQKKLADDKESWEMICDKAVHWLRNEMSQDEFENLLAALGGLF